MIRALFASFLVLTLTSCIGLPKPPPPATVYQLRAPAQGLMAQPPALPAGTRLEVALPGVAAGLDSERIALALDNGRKLDYYAGAKWAAALPDVVQDVAIATLRDSLPGLSVDDDDNMNSPTHRLRIVVQHFAPVYATDATTLPKVNVTLRFALVRLADDALLADATLGTQVAVNANTLAGVTAALEQGLHRVLADAMPRLAVALAPPGKPRR